jgi:hypothetical protein
MAITYKITENGKERSKVVFQTNDWYEASEWITSEAHPYHCIHYEGLDGITVDEFNALNDDPRWPIKVKKVIIE